MSSNHWGDAYYSAQSHTVSQNDWVQLLDKKYPDLKDEVTRTVNQWNLQIRDHLRNETALRLSVGTDTSQIAVRVVDGFPPPLADALRQYNDLAPLLLHKSALEQTEKGLQIIDKYFNELTQLAYPCFDEQVPALLEDWLHTLIKKLNDVKISEQLAGIEQDILGAYFYRESRVEIYWAAIGIIALLHNIPVPALTTVVLAHELAHAYTHQGKDIDGKRWETGSFADADLRIVEGLAQFYTEIVCKKLKPRFPAALDAYQSLLQHQSEPYRVQENWADGHEHQGEVIRFTMVHTRTTGIKRYDRFCEFLAMQASMVGMK